MRKNENGRSMIEMLGVLAIIGVLSVGGIYGYTVAMRKYKANEIVQTASMLATMAHSAAAGEGADVPLSSSGLTTNPGGVSLDTSGTKALKPTSMNGTTSGVSGMVSAVTIKLSTADTALCNQVTEIAPKTGTDTAVRAGYYVSSCTS